MLSPTMQLTLGMIPLLLLALAVAVRPLGQPPRSGGRPARGRGNCSAGLSITFLPTAVVPQAVARGAGTPLPAADLPRLGAQAASNPHPCANRSSIS